MEKKRQVNTSSSTNKVPQMPELPSHIASCGLPSLPSSAMCNPCLLKLQLQQLKIFQDYQLRMMKAYIEFCACNSKQSSCGESSSMYNCCSVNTLMSSNDSAEKSDANSADSRAWESSRY